MVPNVAMNFLNWWTWWDWTNKENNCTKRCYGLMKELFVYVSLIIDWIDGKFSRYFLPNRWQADIDKCFLNIIKCQLLSLTYSMALIKSTSKIYPLIPMIKLFLCYFIYWTYIVCLLISYFQTKITLRQVSKYITQNKYSMMKQTHTHRFGLTPCLDKRWFSILHHHT